MKSRFFGLNAKLALAVLAVGTMFASCYDSENGDVTKPYVAPDAVYTITGTVTNNITGAVVPNAQIAFSGALTGSATTDENGTYNFTCAVDGGAAGTVNLAVSGSDFDDATSSVDIVTIADGQSVIYFKNIVVNYTTYLPEGLEINTSNNSSSQETVMQGENEDGENYVPALDIINNSDEPLTVEYLFNVWTGSRIYEDAEDVMGEGAINRAILDDVKADVRAWIVADLGIAPSAEFDKKEQKVTFVIPAFQALQSVSVSYTIETKNYNYSYGTENGRVVTQSILSVLFNANMIDFSHYHGHGHGHGNGDNAGGGIMVPEL